MLKKIFGSFYRKCTHAIRNYRSSFFGSKRAKEETSLMQGVVSKKSFGTYNKKAFQKKRRKERQSRKCRRNNRK